MLKPNSVANDRPLTHSNFDRSQTTKFVLTPIWDLKAKNDRDDDFMLQTSVGHISHYLFQPFDQSQNLCHSPTTPTDTQTT
jgi:hypothetical protein